MAEAGGELLPVEFQPVIDRAFGRRLKRFLHRPETIALLGEEYMWLDGGCWTLAEAIKLWRPDAELMIVASSRCRAEHVVARCGQLFVDGDGVAGERALLFKMRRFERVPDPHLVDFDRARITEIPEPGERARRIAEALGREFSPRS